MAIFYKCMVPYDLAILSLGIQSREMKTYVYTRTNAWMFVVTLFIIAPNWKQLKYPSTAKWIFYAKT